MWTIQVFMYLPICEHSSKNSMLALGRTHADSLEHIGNQIRIIVGHHCETSLNEWNYITGKLARIKFETNLSLLNQVL